MASPSFIEGLEDRTLLTAAPKVTSVIADNRGEVIIQLSRTVTGVNKHSVKLFTSGANGQIGDADDIRQPSQVVYNVASGRITIKGKLAADAGYRVRIQSLLVSSLDGRHLDGEFTGSFPSGNGHPGGNFAFQVKNDKTKTPSARIYTTDGVITIKLRKDVAPGLVSNFLDYANSGRYDNIFWTRSESGFVIQGGSLQITGTGTSASDVKVTTTDAPAADEAVGTISNTLGTIAFAKNAPNNNTNQFFINMGNNSGLDDTNNSGGFGVFAQATKGLAAAQATNARTTVNLPSLQIDPTTGVSEVPVTNAAEAQSNLNPLADLVVIRRVAVLDKIAPVA